jgi:hypothetical protein
MRCLLTFALLALVPGPAAAQENVVVTLSLPGNFSAQEKGEKTDKTAQAKMVSEQFAKVMFVDKDLASVMKVVAVPFLWPYDSKTVDDVDDLKRKIDGLLSKKGAQQGVIKIHGVKSLDSDAPTYKVMKKGDVIVGLSITPKGAEPLNLFIMVASSGAQPKVVGYISVPPSAFEELKEKN